MKKIDFHIHTSATFRDAHFDFDLATFEKYVTECKIDAVAITNHDIFDCEQFHQIADCLPSIVFPGIEVSVANGHVLVIAAPSQVATFANETEKVKLRIKHAKDYMSVEELRAIFPNLNDYLVIPHTDKDPPMSSDAFLQLRPTCAAGEVGIPLVLRTLR